MLPALMGPRGFAAMGVDAIGGSLAGKMLTGPVADLFQMRRQADAEGPLGTLKGMARGEQTPGVDLAGLLSQDGPGSGLDRAMDLAEKFGIEVPDQARGIGELIDGVDSSADLLGALKGDSLPSAPGPGLQGSTGVAELLSGDPGGLAGIDVEALASSLVEESSVADRIAEAAASRSAGPDAAQELGGP